MSIIVNVLSGIFKMRLHSTERVTPNRQTDSIQGTIRWDAAKSIWFFFMLTGGALAIIWTPSWGGFFVFLATTAITVCAGHSVGMHRLLIHKAFETPKRLEYILVRLGTLVGMAGPFGMGGGLVLGLVNLSRN